jgi:hypothetical protein
VTRRAAATTGLVVWLLAMAWVASLPVYPSYGDGDCGTSALGALFGRGLAGCRTPAVRLLGIWAVASGVAIAGSIVTARLLSRALTRALRGRS